MSTRVTYVGPVDHRLGRFESCTLLLIVSMAELAQMVEHWDVAPGVTGSIPVLRPIEYFGGNLAVIKCDSAPLGLILVARQYAGSPTKVF